ncbi:MAG: cobalamin B12-binding domain-containing protein [Promethearchaeota archaeon]
MELIEELKNAIIEGEEDIALQKAQEIIDSDANVQEAISKGLVAGMKHVGNLYEKHEYFIPEIILSADALNVAFEILKPHIGQTSELYKATAVVGVVKGDIHDIGKTIVAQFLVIAGYNVIDLGRNVHSDDFIKAIKENDAKILCLSTLMTPTLEEMRLIINKLKVEGLKDKVKVLIGGAPTDPDFAKEIGANYCCKDAIEAINLLDKIFKKEGL